MRRTNTHPLLTAFTAVAMFLAAVMKWTTILDEGYRTTDMISAVAFTAGAAIWIYLFTKARKSRADKDEPPPHS